MRFCRLALLLVPCLLLSLACKKDKTPVPPSNPAPAVDTATPTGTATRTPTLAIGFTYTYTPTPTRTPTRTWTPNPTLTPPCGVPGILGPTGDPNTWAGLGNPVYLRMNRWCTSIPVTAVSMSIYLSNVNPGYTCVRMGLYSDNGGTPGGWLGGTNGADCHNLTAGWNTLDLVADRRLEAGYCYWLAFNLQPGPTPVVTPVWIGMNSTSGYEVYDLNPTPGVFPDPWPAVTPTPVSAVFSMRVNYCPE